MRMRIALVNEEEQLKLLPLETQTNRVDGVWNLSSDQVEDGAGGTDLISRLTIPLLFEGKFGSDGDHQY